MTNQTIAQLTTQNLQLSHSLRGSHQRGSIHTSPETSASTGGIHSSSYSHEANYGNIGGMKQTVTRTPQVTATSVSASASPHMMAGYSQANQYTQRMSIGGNMGGNTAGYGGFNTVTRQVTSIPQTSTVSSVISGGQSRGFGSTTATSGGGGLMVMGGGSTRTLHSTQTSFAGGAVFRDESRSHVLSERVVEHEIRVPKKVIREDIVEKVIIVPEKIVHEDIVEDIQIVRQKIVEVAKVIYQEKIVEVPEIVYQERIIEIPEIIYQDKIREVPRLEIQERIIEIPKIITQEKVVEFPEIEYREIPYEKIVEVPEIREQVVLKQIPVPQYIERPVPEYVNVEVEQEVSRNVPVPVELTTTLDLVVPRMRPRYTKVEVPLYVPRFIEVAMPAEMMDAAEISQAEHYASQVAVIASQTAASLCEVERLAGTIKELDGFYSSLIPGHEGDMGGAISNFWNSGKFDIVDGTNIPCAEEVEVRVAGRNMMGTIQGGTAQKMIHGGYRLDGKVVNGGVSGRESLRHSKIRDKSGQTGTSEEEDEEEEEEEKSEAEGEEEGEGYESHMVTTNTKGSGYGGDDRLTTSEKRSSDGQRVSLQEDDVVTKKTLSSVSVTTITRKTVEKKTVDGGVGGSKPSSTRHTYSEEVVELMPEVSVKRKSVETSTLRVEGGDEVEEEVELEEEEEEESCRDSTSSDGGRDIGEEEVTVGVREVDEELGNGMRGVIAVGSGNGANGGDNGNVINRIGSGQVSGVGRISGSGDILKTGSRNESVGLEAASSSSSSPRSQNQEGDEDEEGDEEIDEEMEK